MVRNVSTRWNSTAMLVGQSRELRQALNLLVLNKDHNKARGVRLQRFQLSEKEWQLLDELYPLLEAFLRATQHISTNKVALIHEVIPIIDIITGFLEDYITNTSLLPAVRAAASRGLAMINKYYSKTDDSVVYRIAMVMHPRCKTAYFTKQNWPMTWIDTAIELARAEWEKYKPKETSMAQPSISRTRSLSDRLFEELNDAMLL
ncbi:putative protein dimerization activity [Lyophyllum shimeji]|uniref:Uncharacterized protein n=1 Tax=Lyophyllum shimeji TaxID=47721 RepID=A0A9P3PRJ9_LYOSH|nr:putative protein dimerization activity [Lyophyllum shimeji]